MSQFQMRATLTTDKKLIFSNSVPQSEGEHLTTVLEVAVPIEFVDYDFYLEFLCPKERKMLSQKLVEQSQDSEFLYFNYNIENTLLVEEGLVLVQLIAVDKNNSKVVFRSQKSKQSSFYVSDSIVAVDKSFPVSDYFSAIVEKSKYAEGLIKTIDDAILAVQEDIESVKTVSQNAAEFLDDVTQMVNNGEFDGENATISVGNVSVGQPATITNSGTPTHAVLDFVIPKGEKGDKGDTGAQGIQGIKGDKGDRGDGSVISATHTKSTTIHTFTTTENLPTSGTISVRAVLTANIEENDTFVLTDGSHSYSGSMLTEAGQPHTLEIGEVNPVVLFNVQLTGGSNATAFFKAGGGGKIKSFAEMSWAEIAKISEEGKAAETFGGHFIAGTAKKTITLTTGEQITLVILGFDHDNLVGGGKAGLTIGMENCLATTYRMNSTNTNVGSWNSSEMRTLTIPTLLAQLPSDLQAVLKTVVKKQTEGNASKSIITSEDKLFLFSEREVSNASSPGYISEGEQYHYWKVTKDGAISANCIKYLSNGSGSATNWWLRSPHVGSALHFRRFDSTGGVNGNYSDSAFGVSFGFCI